MVILKKAVAGTLESSDAYVTVEPAEKLEVEIVGRIYLNFKEQFDKVVYDTIAEFNVVKGKFYVEDRGANDITIASRIRQAITRSLQ